MYICLLYIYSIYLFICHYYVVMLSICLVKITFQMIIDLAVQEPRPYCCRDHLCSGKGGRKQTHDIHTVPAVQECVSVEINRVNVDLVSHAKEMQSNRVVLAKLNAR